MKWVQAHESRDCGAACLATVALYYGERLDVAAIASLAQTTRQGARLDRLCDAAHALGFAASYGKIRDGALNNLPMPAIFHLQREEGDHYVVLLKIKRDQMVIADPSLGIVRLQSREILKQFSGLALLLRPDAEFGARCVAYRGQNPWLVNYNIVKENWRPFSLASLAAAMAALTSLAVPLFVSHLIDQGFGVHISATPLAFTAAIFISIAVARSVFALLKQVYVAVLSVQVEGTYLRRFLRRVPWLGMSFWDRCHPGDVVARTNDAVQLRLALTGPILNLQMELAYLIVSSFLLASMSWALLGITLLAVISAFLLEAFVRERELLNLRVVRARMTELTGSIIEIITGIRVLKTYCKEMQYVDKAEQKHAEVLVALRRSNTLSGIAASTSFLINGIGIAAVIVIAQKMVMLHGLTPGQLTYLVAVSSVMMGSSDTISRSLTTCEDLAVSAERLAHTQTLPVESRTGSAEGIQELEANPLEFENVSFRYDDGGIVLENFNFSLRSGEVVGMKGESGSGKSTFALLCNGLYAASAGQIRVFGRPLEEWNLNSLRKRICVVYSDGNLFSGTVRSNIEMGTGVCDARVEEAARMAHAHEFIQSLPGGYGYQLGHTGAGLSSGQRQRVALARVFLMRPDVLILDEATSNLDVRIERQVIYNLLASRSGLSTVFISHRPETLTYASSLYELIDGRLATKGSIPVSPHPDRENSGVDLSEIPQGACK